MDPIQLTAKLLEAARTFDCCRREGMRPASHWKNHCVNCGVHAGMAHTEDCPPQRYEVKEGA